MNLLNSPILYCLQAIKSSYTFQQQIINLKSITPLHISGWNQKANLSDILIHPIILNIINTVNTKDTEIVVLKFNTKVLRLWIWSLGFSIFNCKSSQG